MKEQYDRKLLYAIHHKEQYDLDEARFKEYSEFLEFKRLLVNSHGELLANDLLRDQEEQLEGSFLQKQIDLDIKQFEQWKYYHGIEDPDLIRDPEFLFGSQSVAKKVYSIEEKEVSRDVALSQTQVTDRTNVAEVPEGFIAATHNPTEESLTSVKNLAPGPVQNPEQSLQSASELRPVFTPPKREMSDARKEFYTTKSQQRQNRILGELYKLKDAKDNTREYKKERDR